ncbi:MAG: TonB-dependent receptor [Erythrobacter sp.]
MQVLSTENQQAVGAFDPAQILQRSEAAAGQQIDATFQGFVLDNGPGSQTVNLRGLGADRTLLLVNGRRLAPAGVEGAPANPSINLIPATLVDRYDLLLDGASSVYGADAVAGVGNIILRKDFDGLELQANGNLNEQGAGNDYSVSAAWGFNTDRGFFGIGAEYSYRDEVLLEDRDFLRGCNRHYEIDQDGNILTTDLRSRADILVESGGAVDFGTDDCKRAGIAGLIQVPTFYGFLYRADGQGNSGIPGFDDDINAFGTPVDADGDGILDVNYYERNINGVETDVTFISPQDTYNVFTYGEYTFPGEANITPFFEANYSRIDVSVQNGGSGQFFPWVPATNQFNPCNFVGNPNGVDCSRQDNLFNGLDTFAGGAFALPEGRLLSVRPVPSIRGDRNNVESTLEQYRGVLGVRGDLPFIGSTWTFEVAGVYSRSEGRSSRLGVREDRLALALGIDPTADFNGDGVVDNDGDGIADDYVSQQNSPLLPGGPCDAANLANPGLAPPGLSEGCVPVNLFAPSVLDTIPGDLASQAERDYLFGARTFDTTYEQTLLSGFVTGDLFDLPAGPVGVVVGAEWREDSIDSQPDFVAANGLFWGFFADGGATGSKWLREVFGEMDIPLLAGETLAEELTVNISGRLTDEEFYGTNGTYSIKAGWRPVAPLLFKFSYGTSFRAPNLRENFLRSQSGFGNLADPCAVPNVAFDPLGGGYQPNQDPRDNATLDNCRREGRDPTRVGIDQAGNDVDTVASVEIATGGTFDLEPETSRSITTGFAFEESWASGFDFSFNFNYYDIKLTDSIVEPNPQFIINDCFTRQDETRSPFCDALAFGQTPESRFLVSGITAGFINFDTESVRGIDLNAVFGYPVMVGGEEFDLTLAIRANHLIERSSTFIDDTGAVAFDEDAGEFGFPSWTGRATFNVRWEDLLFTWQTRYIGDVEQQAEGIDPLSDAFGFGPDGTDTGFFGDTCLGNGSPGGVVAGDGVFCRDVGFAEEWFEHTASIRYDADSFRIILGVTNIFDNAPPLIDTNEVFGISNTPIGNGYNLDGREFFGQILYRF